MFLSFIPAWLACCLLYSTSKNQHFFKEPLPAVPTRLTAIILMWIMVVLLFQVLPSISALITGFSLICCFLPLVTLIAAYKKHYLYLTSVLVCLFSVMFTLMGGDL
jgi:hypothetical protein